MDTTIVAPDEEAETTQTTQTTNAPVFADDPNHPQRWMHRRRMAYISLYSIIATTCYVLSPYMPLDRLTAASDVISWFYFAMVSIVGAYMGFATWSAKSK